MGLLDSVQVSRDWTYSGAEWRLSTFKYGAVTLYGSGFHRDSSSSLPAVYRSHDPGGRSLRFRLIPFRSPLLRESSFLSLPVGTEMFQFPTFAPHSYGFTVR
jgi:hypothetical protein